MGPRVCVLTRFVSISLVCSNMRIPSLKGVLDVLKPRRSTNSYAEILTPSLIALEGRVSEKYQHDGRGNPWDETCVLINFREIIH